MRRRLGQGIKSVLSQALGKLKRFIESGSCEDAGALIEEPSREQPFEKKKSVTDGGDSGGDGSTSDSGMRHKSANRNLPKEEKRHVYINYALPPDITDEEQERIHRQQRESAYRLKRKQEEEARARKTEANRQHKEQERKQRDIRRGKQAQTRGAHERIVAEQRQQRRLSSFDVRIQSPAKTPKGQYFEF